ncbi:hypothetical protein [Winogradskyella sp. PG-2]|uniref:hypothetical protein n=1 Tax=Winogradskyella sp. PG-2 TaxID=754409 RepID=UPI0005EF2BB9|nr:hypothetical protein [Winogradskyella sp. PG-2]
MKSIFSILMVFGFFIIVTNCSSDDDSTSTSNTNTLSPISIEFVNENGTPIATDCLDVNENYAIQIVTEQEGSGSIAVTQIQYTLNGALYSMTFNQIGYQRQPVVLVDGQNIAQLVDTGVTDEIRFIIQDDFELVL